jgi:hypothetical protein
LLVIVLFSFTAPPEARIGVIITGIILWLVILGLIKLFKVASKNNAIKKAQQEETRKLAMFLISPIPIDNPTIQSFGGSETIYIDEYKIGHPEITNSIDDIHISFTPTDAMILHPDKTYTVNVLGKIPLKDIKKVSQKDVSYTEKKPKTTLALTKKGKLTTHQTTQKIHHEVHTMNIKWQYGKFQTDTVFEFIGEYGEQNMKRLLTEFMHRANE